MAAQIYLVTKSTAAQPEKTIIDDIHAMIVNADDGGSAADTIAEAIATARAIGHPLYDGYFDTTQLLGPPTAGVMTTDEDAILLLRRGKTESIA